MPNLGLAYNEHMAGSMKKNVLTWLALISAIGFAVLVFVLLSPSEAPAVPTVKWMPSSVNQKLGPGQSQSIAVSFTASENISKTTVRVVPNLQSLVQVTPSTITNIQKGQTAHLMLNMAVPIAASPGTFQGTIQLLVGSSVIAQPLPVNVTVVWPAFTDPATGVGITYTTFGSTGTVSSDVVDFGSKGTGTVYYVRFPTQSSPTPATQYLITVINNSQYQSIQDWFIGNIDPNQLLLNSGSFQLRDFANGVEALVLVGPIPSTWDRGPVSEIFAMSASKKSVVTIATSDDDTMRRDLGLSSDTIEGAYLQILENINLP
jgi:hypothetical protein